MQASVRKTICCGGNSKSFHSVFGHIQPSAGRREGRELKGRGADGPYTALIKLLQRLVIEISRQAWRAALSDGTAQRGRGTGRGTNEPQQ